MAKRTTKTTVAKDSSGLSRNTIIIIAAIAVGIVGLITLLILNVRGPAEIRGLKTFARQERGHVDDSEVETDGPPPPGGQHSATWQNCGIYREELEAAHVVHSMEHGAVWITYDPDLPQDQINQLEEMVRGETYTILSPHSGLNSPITLTAWQVELEVQTASDRRIRQFLDQYQIGPYTPERGASCANGIGEPIP